MDLATFAGADFVDVELAGRTYRVGELTLREWAPVQAWIKATVPGPLSSLASPDFARLPAAVKREVLGEALDRDRTSWPPRIGSRSWFLALDHPGGHAVALRAMLGKHSPAITEAECEAIAGSATFDQILPVAVAALGLFGPKSPAPAPSPTATTSPGATAGTTSATSPTSSPAPGDGPGTTS